MMCFKVSGERAVFVLFSLIFFTSCSQKIHQWKIASNKGAHSCFSSSRLYLSPEDTFSGLEVDIISTTKGLSTYINVFGMEIEPENTSPEGYPTVNVTISIDGQSQNFLGCLLQGGHRVLLQEQASQLLITALHEQKTVEISVAHYSTTVIHENFTENYQKLIFNPSGTGYEKR